MWEKIEGIAKDLLIIAYAVTLLIFFLNILFYNTATWTERDWVLAGEIITFGVILAFGIFSLIKDWRIK